MATIKKIERALSKEANNWKEVNMCQNKVRIQGLLFEYRKEERLLCFEKPDWENNCLFKWPDMYQFTRDEWKSLDDLETVLKESHAKFTSHANHYLESTLTIFLPSGDGYVMALAVSSLNVQRETTIFIEVENRIGNLSRWIIWS